jgi:hypothetical protein
VMCFDAVESEVQKKKRHEMYREIGWLLVAGLRCGLGLRFWGFGVRV